MQTLKIKNYIFLVGLLMFTASSVVLGQSLEIGPETKSVAVISYGEFLNDLLSKERYLDNLSANIKKAAEAKGDKGFGGLYEQYVSRYGKPKSVAINDFGYRGGPEGKYHNFDIKEEYDQFYEFSRFFNIRNALFAYRNVFLKSATADEVNRLFRYEVVSATQSYRIGDYMTSRLQFQDLYRAYSPYYRDNLDEILFLLAESSFGLKYYDEARLLYKQVIATYPKSSKTAMAAYRLLFMDYVYNDVEQLRKNIVIYKPSLSNDQDIYSKALLLAATVEYKEKQYTKALKHLSSIPEEYSDPMVSYAMATVYMAMGDEENAKISYQKVSGEVIWPWVPKINSYIKNSTYLQLGYIYYREGNKLLDEARLEYSSEKDEQARFLQVKAHKSYDKAEELFGRVSKGMPEFQVAKLGEYWAQFKQSNYGQSKRGIDEFFKQYNSSDNLYQALFLSGYMTQTRRPTDPDMALKDYYYVYNGVAANEFLEKYLAQKRVLREQNRNTQSVTASSSSPNEVAAAKSLEGLISESLRLMRLDRKNIVSAERTMIAPDRQETLKINRDRLTTLSDSLAKNGFVALSSYAQRSTAAVSQILDLAVQPVSDDVRLFADHAAAILASEIEDYNILAKTYKGVLLNEAEQAQRQIESLERSNMSDARDESIKEFYQNNATMVRNRDYAFLTYLYERDFYDSGNIESAGTSAQYAFSGLIYNQIKANRQQIDNYRRVVEVLRRATKNKVQQLEFYLSEIDKDYNVGPAKEQSGNLQQEFDGIFGDFRKAFFIGTEHLRVSTEKEQKTEPVQ
ncbi:MAG: tetratricopeptide repeat protein [Chlorobiales bacterium]|nr:tetratricopeptide repeat protein [Chlorobiales bacterium]